MAMTKDDYEALGRNQYRLFRDGHEVPHPYPLGGSSWQGRHYWLGWEREVMRLTLLEKLTARQEHIRLLKKEINTGKIMTANRLLRISAKIQHLECREALSSLGG